MALFPEHSAAHISSSLKRVRFFFSVLLIAAVVLVAIVVRVKSTEKIAALEAEAKKAEAVQRYSVSASVVDLDDAPLNKKGAPLTEKQKVKEQRKKDKEQKEQDALKKAEKEQQKQEELRQKAREKRKKEAEQMRLEEQKRKDDIAKNRGKERADGQHRGVRKIGVYLSAGNVAKDAHLADTIERLKDAGGSTFVFDVKGPYVYFESDAKDANDLNLVRPLYELPDIIETAKEHDLYTIARFVAANDPEFGYVSPESRIRHPKTKVAIGSVWVDLGKPTTLRYNKEILFELAASGVDEINIDYIRYPTEYSNASIGLTVDEKVNNVTTFVKMARDAIEKKGRHTLLGVSTYAILGWNYDLNLETLGQDVAGFAPYVDIISPMAYPSTFKEGAYYNPSKHPGSRMYYLVNQTMEGYKKFLGPEHSHKLRPWIQGYFVTNQNMKDQIQAVFDSGSCGFTVWSAGNYYDVLYKVLPEMTIPKGCKK